MLYTLKGLVVRENIATENAKYIHILTAERGKLSVLVRGSVKLRSRFTASTRLFCYSEFVVYEKGGKYSLNDATLIESCFDICRDYGTVTLGTYIINAAEYLTGEEQPDVGILRLTLNTLYALAHREQLDRRLVKGAFELRLAALAGFAPDLSGCRDCGCGSAEDDVMFMNIMEGCIICRDCIDRVRMSSHVENEIAVDDTRTALILVPLRLPVLLAMRYALTSELSRLFSFTLTPEFIPPFNDVCERYLENHIDHRFPVLDMLDL